MGFGGCKIREFSVSNVSSVACCSSDFTMVIMFQDRFSESIRSGIKCQTIRRNARVHSGDVLSLRRWAGKPYRSHQEVLIDAICIEIRLITIRKSGIEDGDFFGPDNALAVSDGFRDFNDMVAWVDSTYGVPFTGVLIRWSHISKS